MKFLFLILLLTALKIQTEGIPVPQGSSQQSNTGQNVAKKSGSKYVKFVGLRCGIGARWNPVAQVCSPYNLDSGESKSEESLEKRTPEPDTPPVDNGVSLEEEIVRIQIVAIHCGIGYRYLRKEKICLPLEYGQEIPEHKRSGLRHKEKQLLRK